MKRLTLLTVLVLSLLSTPVLGEWTKVTENVDGNTYYVDFERIRKHGGYVYYWDLQDYLKPNSLGYWSYKSYIQGDCKLFRYKRLSFSSHKEPMGRGTGAPHTPPEKWGYPPPNSPMETILKRVCSR